MRIATWNVNPLKASLEKVTGGWSAPGRMSC
jgi:exonuclease III